MPSKRSRGRTRWDAANGFEYRWLVDDLVAFVDALGLDSFHLVGFSMGGAEIVRYAADLAASAIHGDSSAVADRSE